MKIELKILTKQTRKNAPAISRIKFRKGILPLKVGIATTIAGPMDTTFQENTPVKITSRKLIVTRINKHW